MKHVVSQKGLKIFGSNDRIALLRSSPLVCTTWEFQPFSNLSVSADAWYLTSMNCAGDQYSTQIWALGMFFTQGNSKNGSLLCVSDIPSADNSTSKC